MNTVVTLLMTLLCASAALAQHDRKICQPYPDSGKPMPSLPNGYSVRTEINIISENATVDVHEYFDKSLNMSAYEMVRPDMQLYTIMNANTNQIIIIEPAEEGLAKSCKVKDLRAFMPMFGHQTKESDLYQLKDAFNYVKGAPAQFASDQVLRGEKVQTWKSCVYDKAWKSTFDVTWYFSGRWKTSSGSMSIPIRMHVVGKTTDNGVTTKHERIYDFSEYEPSAPDRTVFELHSGSYCKGIKQKKELPKLPISISYGLETVEYGEEGNVRTDSFVYYNQIHKLYRMDYVESNKGAPGYKMGPLTLIHDYNTGVAYLIYQNRATCDISKIPQMGEDVETVDSKHVRMKTSKEFFDFDKNNFIYQGQRAVRGITCDIWIGSRNDWPLNNSATSFWEWAFSEDEVLSNAGGNTMISFPVTLKMTQPKSNMNLLHNVYGIDNHQSYEHYDVSMCFDDAHRLDYHFAMQGTYSSVVRNNEELFIHKVRVTLSTYAGISPIRISNIKIDYDSDDVLVSFSILDRPQITGDVKKGHSLEDAITRLVSGINNMDLSIDVDKGKTVKMRPDTFKRVVNIAAPQLGKFKPGDMAGIGIGMLLVGLLIGGFATRFIIRKKLDDKFKAVKFDSQMEE